LEKRASIELGYSKTKEEKKMKIHQEGQQQEQRS